MKRCERIRRRDPMQLAQEGFDGVLADAGLAGADIEYTATTGEDKMTSQCASGSGQFLENIARYLGVTGSGRFASDCGLNPGADPGFPAPPGPSRGTVHRRKPHGRSAVTEI